MQTSAAGTRGRPPRSPTACGSAKGFTLLELLVVVAIMALATAGVGLAMRDSSESQLERDAQRLAALLETARAHSRMSANTVVWRSTPNGFVFEGLPGNAQPTSWLGNDVVASSTAAVVLGPEPIIGPQRIRLASVSQPARSLSITTDGVRPFKVTGDAAVTQSSP
jgi:general secretion pathway protein H